jgi:hypothetical protein
MKNNDIENIHSSLLQTMQTYFEVFLIDVVDTGQHDTHEDVEVDDDEDGKEKDKPVALVVSRHPVIMGCTGNTGSNQTAKQKEQKGKNKQN